jgi:DNA-binding CsgD family transcriptional regulator
MLDLPPNNILKVENTHIEFCKEIATICQPLHMFEINYFNYIRSYKDGSRISLSNHSPFSEHYYDKQYYLKPAISKIPNKNRYNYCLWLSFQSNAIFQDLSNLFDIGNGITITQHFSDYSDFYYFGSRTDNMEINNFYLVKIQLLERFITYFNDAASKLIQHAGRQRIFLPMTRNIVEEQQPIPIYNNINLRDNFVKNTPIKKYRINDGIEVNIFTPRQMDCIIGILDGKTAKEIARDNNLSVRTVENYINTIKMKFGCYKKNELIKKLKSLPALENFCFLKE